MQLLISSSDSLYASKISLTNIIACESRFLITLDFNELYKGLNIYRNLAYL